MKKYALELAYKGTGYAGWQRQPNALSVQEVLEDTLSKILGRKTVVSSCSRTDAGVHARQFFVHIKTNKALPENLLAIAYHQLPGDICLKHFWEVPFDFHAQHSVVSRSYEYLFHLSGDPFIHELSTYCDSNGLDMERMQHGIMMIKKAKDFAAFCKQPDQYSHTCCEVTEVGLESIGSDQYRFFITADRFLRGMIRLLVGNLLDLGYGRLSEADFREALLAGRPLSSFKSAYPQGLYLSAVRYSEKFEKIFKIKVNK